MAPLKRLSSEENRTLFPLAAEFRIARLGRVEARTRSDELVHLKDLIVASEEMYPRIGQWFEDKVVPGLRHGLRTAWVAYERQKPIAAAVLKLGQNSKFCHVRVSRDFEDKDVGQLFFTFMTLETRHQSKEIHFTLPESLWERKMKFFESFGFTRVRKSVRQYRNGDTELACSTPQIVAQRAALERLPELVARFSVNGYSLCGDLLVSMKPQYAKQILCGSKLIEIRKKFSEKWIGCKAVLYSSSPQQELVGEARIRSITSGSPVDIWTQFGTSIGCPSQDFLAYVGSATEVSAIELDEVFPYKYPISLSQISHLLGEDLRPPQSYCDLRLDKGQGGWALAASVASVMHGRLSNTR